MDDGIFVAHNVNFDYGFISHGIRNGSIVASGFPKLCTVAGMRRRYPGHKFVRSREAVRPLRLSKLETQPPCACAMRGRQATWLNLMNLKREGLRAPAAPEEAGLTGVFAEANSGGDGAGVRVRNPPPSQIRSEPIPQLIFGLI